ncbi:MAG: S-layer homology domain-containing protein [Peptoniphilus harei]|nr:S-layer homology domain-containing protein [Peptoniphilus harei]
MNKKIISLVLALVMVLGTFTSVFAETAKKEEAKKPAASEKVEKIVGKDNKIQYVIDKKLVEGYEDGSYGLDKNIKRSEITRLLVLANGQEDLAKRLQGSMKIYNDVDVKHWANGVISVGTTSPSDANGLPMLAGYPDHSFKPERDVTYAELAKMLVVLVKEDLTKDMVDHAIWATDWMRWAALLGITDDVTIENSDKAANRADAFTMVYNALYAMKEFKRVPANEVRGIVSNLTSGKLTLNQDDKKVYDITNATVIVEGKSVRSNIVSVHSLKNLDLYKGSLVRVLINDKNEVTHIIELGNPKDLAIEKGSTWEGVADKTVETDYYPNIETLEGIKDSDIKGAYATVTLNGAKTKGEKIVFHKANGTDLASLKINDKTEVYVANPYNNIMRQVKDVNEALSLIGFHNYNGYKIPNVYAGFDTDDHTSAVKVYNSVKNTAKVIVFNVVSKDNGGDLYRVINSSSSKFSTTLEDTDGKLYDRDNVLNEVHFPLNYGDLLDVIDVRGDVITTKLDHSKTKEYPVVKVERIFDNDEIQVVDRFGNETLLYVGDADIFNAKQYKELAKGDYLQFRANPFEKGKELYNDGKLLLNARDIEIVSILEDTKDTRDLFAESGSVLNVVQGIEDHTVVGIIKWVGKDQVEIKIESDNWDAGLNNTTRTYKVDEELAEALKAHIGENVKFKAENKEFDKAVRAYDFVLNDGMDTPIVKAADNKSAIEKVEAAAKNGELKKDSELVKAVEKQIKDETSKAKSDALQERLDKALNANLEKLAEKLVNAFLNKDFKSEKLADENKVYTEFKNAYVKDADLKAKLDKKVIDARAVRADYDKVVSTKVADVAATELEPAKAEKALKDNVVALPTTTVKEVKLTNIPADNKNYAAGAELKAKVTLEQGDAKLEADIVAHIAQA